MSFMEMNFGSGTSLPFQFSTEEQITNCKWLDGKDIYCTTFTVDATSAHSSDTTENHNIENIDKVIAYDAKLFRSTGYTVQVPLYSTTSWRFHFTISPTSYLYNNVGFLGTLYVTVYYTKTT